MSQERSYHIFYMLCNGAPPDLIKKLRCALPTVSFVQKRLAMHGGCTRFRNLQLDMMHHRLLRYSLCFSHGEDAARWRSVCARFCSGFRV